MILTLLIFLVIGFTYDYNIQAVDIKTVQTAISSSFNTTPFLFLVPAILFSVIMFKTPPLPALMIGTLLCGLFAIIFQPDIIRQFGGADFSYLKSSHIGVMKAMFGDISLHTNNIVVNELLHTSGMKGMLNTVWLILTAMIFGGVIDAGGLLERITRAIVEKANTTGSLVKATVISCIFFNTTASDQYISIVVPGRI
ncbi:MAG: hypothetical protein PF541_17000 [Prolixibacteraceae bacterium]|nr:hypothetical protein [Prolixibacteraceae bacterium]